MGKINVLGFEIANLIAAGEVVDRPSSIVKELLENSIDSGANVVTIEIKNGGIDFIRVSDNGCGMEPEDLPIAVKRHATSKITGAEDLNHILTLGFRGEALAAISSVTKIRILSKTKNSELGALLESEAGEVVNLTETGCAEGTTVIVEELFFNTPARKKFLKKSSVEATTVSALVEKLALSMPHVAVKLIIDGDVKFTTSGDGSLYNAMYAVLGKDIAKKMIPIDRTEGGVRVEGYISSPMLLKSTRNMQNFFINSRYVKSKTASAAIEQAYESYIPSDKFPSCVLNIVLDPSTVDVNVHPAKMEVKFSDEKTVFDAIFYAVRTALDSKIVRPELQISKKQTSFVSDAEVRNIVDAFVPKNFYGDNPETKSQPVITHSISEKTIPLPENTSKKVLPFLEIPNTSAENPKPDIIKQNQSKNSISENVKTISEFLKIPVDTKNSKDISQKDISQTSETAENDTLLSKNTIDENKKIIPEYYIIGEAYNSYIILQLEDKIMLIDKHAAHERIIFEDLKKSLQSAPKAPQILMIPVKVELTTTEIAAVSEFETEIKAIGFNFFIDGNILNITEIPNEISSSAAYDTMDEFAKRLSGGLKISEVTRDAFFEIALYQAACKAAIKAGRVYETEHIKWICEKLLLLDDIKVCPHGRPVAFEITKTSIERQFKRIN